MAIRKRPTRPGLDRMEKTGCKKEDLPSSMICWLADYRDASGARRFGQFPTKTAAVAWLDQTKVDVKHGVHVAASQSKTVAAAAELWLNLCRKGAPDGKPGPLEPSTVREYERHVAYATDPEIGIGSIKLTQLSALDVDAFLRRLREQGKTAATARKVRGSLATMLAFAQEPAQKLVARNVLREGVRRKRSNGEREQQEVVIPSKAELKLLLAADDQTPLWFRAFLTKAIWTGLRMSELRGVPWRCVLLDRGVIKVRQRADFAGDIGAPKSKAGNRDIDLPLSVRALLEELFVEQGYPSDPDHLVFPTATGKPMSHSNIVQRFFEPLQRRLGMEGPKLDIDGKPVLDRNGKPVLLYTPHSLRHAAASLFIEQGWTVKEVQVAMGHSSILITMNTYAKLFRDLDGDRAAKMAKLEASLLG